MVTTLYNIMLATYEELGLLRYGIATGGSSTTLVDSGLKGDNKVFKGSCAFLTYDAAGTGVAPEAEFAEVTGYTASSGTLTVSFSAAPGAADEYALSDPRLGPDKMKGLINRAMQKIGDIPTLDETLSTATGQTEYTIPTVAKGNRLRRVFTSQYSDLDDHLWREELGWYEAPGAIYDLHFTEQPETGNTIRLLYMAKPARLRVKGDTISPYINLERIVAETVYLYFKSDLRITDGRADTLVDNVRDAIQELENARRRHPIYDPGTPHKPILTSASDTARSRGRRGQYGPWNPNA